MKTQVGTVAVDFVCANQGIKMKQIAVEIGYVHGKNDLTYRYFYSKVSQFVKTLYATWKTCNILEYDH